MSVPSRRAERALSLALGLPLLAGLELLSGCASAGSLPTVTPLSGTTSVTLLAGATGNDRLQRFNIEFTSLALTSQSGKSVSLLTAPVTPEFIHVNGTASPLAATTVPQDIYTALTATIDYSQFTCVALTSTGGLDISTYANRGTPAGPITFTLPTPITITGAAMGLALNLQVSKSATYPACIPVASTPFSVSPTFVVTPVSFSSQPTSAANGRLTGLNGVILSLGATGSAGTAMSIASSDGTTLAANFNAATALQGATTLAPGMPVNFDANFQQDGSLLATRIAVADTDPSNLSVSTGPVLFSDTIVPIIDQFGTQAQGALFKYGLLGAVPFGFGNAVFNVFDAPANLKSLPFTPIFNGSTMVPGQNVTVTSHAATITGGSNATPAAAIALMPQTIDGTVTSVANAGGFEVFTVALSSLDLFPALAVQQGQTTATKNPGTVVVYADNATQTLNSTPPVAGSVLRFHGLIFNDSGTLRMDASRIDDGVTP